MQKKSDTELNSVKNTRTQLRTIFGIVKNLTQTDLRTGNFYNHAGIDTVRIFDNVFVSFVDAVKFSSVAVNFFGDERQRIIFFHGVIFIADFDILI